MVVSFHIFWVCLFPLVVLSVRSVHIGAYIACKCNRPVIQVTIQADIQHPDSWPQALGYTSWIEEVWVNYVGNALKYGGDPEIGVVPRVKLGADVLADQQQVRFWVMDNGSGLSAAEQAQLFTQFTRLHTDRAEGHGLGFSILQRIVEKLGGTVGAESTLGKGSTFWFTLPVGG